MNLPDKPIATRLAFGKALAEAGEQIKEIVALDADISKGTFTSLFAKKFPERFFNIGVAEQNMMAVAAGFATTGKIAFVSTYAVFASMRACEQVRTMICYPNLNVKIAPSHGGINVGSDGVSHQGIEDVAIMRALPNMTVIEPADGIATFHAVYQAAMHKGPVYIRLIRSAVPLVHNKNTKFQIGKSVLMKDGTDVTIIAVGIMVYESLKAADILQKKGISARVIDMYSVKPIDKEALLKAAEETGAIIVAQDHTVIGGLGGAVCEFLSAVKPTPVSIIGLKDEFAQSGTKEELFARYGLSYQHISEAAEKVIKMKS